MKTNFDAKRPTKSRPKGDTARKQTQRWHMLRKQTRKAGHARKIPEKAAYAMKRNSEAIKAMKTNLGGDTCHKKLPQKGTHAGNSKLR